MIKFKEAVLIQNKSVLFIADVSHEEREHYIVINVDTQEIKIPYSNIACIVKNKEEKKLSLPEKSEDMDLTGLAQAEQNIEIKKNKKKK